MTKIWGAVALVGCMAPWTGAFVCAMALWTGAFVCADDKEAPHREGAETRGGQQFTSALTLPQVRYGLSLLLFEVFCTLGLDDIYRQVHRQLLRNELAQFYHHHTRTCLPPRKLRRDIQEVEVNAYHFSHHCSRFCTWRAT